MEIKNFFYQASLLTDKKGVLKQEKKEEDKKTSSFNTRDKVEVSQASAERAEKLALVQKRVKSGFYFSSNITDDISEKLSKTLDPYT